LPFCSGGKAGNIPKPKVLNIHNLREITQDEDYIISNPLKMLYRGDKIYILDRKLLQVLVFTDAGYSHSIGRPGQGPGEISQPVSFDIADDKLYVANFTDRIEVFDLTGTYLKTIKIKIKPDSIPSFWDFKLFDNIFYFSKDIGQIKVQRYGPDGAFIDDFIGGGSKIESSRDILSSPCNIYIVPDNNKLILFNQFNGDIEVYDLNNGDCLSKTQNYDSFTMEESLLIRDIISSSQPNSNDKEVKIIILLRSTIDQERSRLLVTPSQVSLEDEKKRSLVYSYDFTGNKIEENILNFTGSDKKLIRICCFTDKKVIILDDELNLYIGKFK